MGQIPVVADRGWIRRIRDGEVRYAQGRIPRDRGSIRRTRYRRC